MICNEIANNRKRSAGGKMQEKISTLSRALVLDGQVSLAVLDTTALVREGGRRHGMRGGALALFGKVLTAAGYLCGWLKKEDCSLTVSLDTDGDYGKISVSGDGNLCLRGYLQNAECRNGRLGNGTLSVIFDRGEGLPFAGTVPIVSEETEENFAFYFSESEQRPTGIALSVVLDGDGTLLRAGGAFLQALPFAETWAREKIFSERARLKKLLDDGGYQEIFSCFGAEWKETRETRFFCRCSEEKAESLILSMGKKEAENLCEELGEISVHCDYCNTDYRFSRERVKNILNQHE